MNFFRRYLTAAWHEFLTTAYFCCYIFPCLRSLRLNNLNTFTYNVIKLCLLCLLSTESKLIILVIVAETKSLHVVNLLVSYGENIEEKWLTLEIRHWSWESKSIINNLKINLIIYYEARPHLSIIRMNCRLSEVLKTDLQKIVVSNSVLIKIIPYRSKALRNQDNFH